MGTQEEIIKGQAMNLAQNELLKRGYIPSMEETQDKYIQLTITYMKLRIAIDERWEWEKRKAKQNE